MPPREAPDIAPPAPHEEAVAAPDGARETLLERAGSAAAGVSTLGPRHPKARAAVQGGLVVLIFGFLIGFVVSQWNRLPDFDWHFKPGWLVVAGAAIFFFYALQGECWRWIVQALGEKIPPAPSRAVWGKSLIARYVPTNVLMLVGRIVMAERLGVKKRVCLASIVYELGIGVCTAVMAGSYFVITLPGLEDQSARYLVLVLIPLALVALHPRVFAPVAGYALRKLGREPLPRALPFSRVLVFCAVYLVVWAAIGIGVYAFSLALHPLSVSELPYVAASYAVAFCVAVATFLVPGGLGTRDAALATAIGAVLPTAVAAAIAVAFRIFQTGIELSYVGLASLLGRRSP